MPLPTYFPDPETVSGNVASEKHRPRVQFLRRVCIGHCAANLITAGLSIQLVSFAQIGQAAALFIVSLAALTLQRRFLDKGLLGVSLSVALAVPTVVFLAIVWGHLRILGLPVDVIVPISLAIGVYSALCGNDFSYWGQLTLSYLVCLGFLIFMFRSGDMSVTQAIGGACLGFVYLFYFSYDLSMIVKRRRIGEELSGVVDFYRDLVNFVTYSVRVYLHWKRFRFI